MKINFRFGNVNLSFTLNVPTSKTMYLPVTGIHFTDGKFWENQRHSSLRNMRDFGFGMRCNERENIEKYET
jgi:hypothetical protein